MRLEYVSREEAQATADKIHAWLIANNAAYAKSVADGQTLRWAIPRQEKDHDGNVIDQSWQVALKERAKEALTPAEKTEIIDPKLEDPKDEAEPNGTEGLSTL